MNRSSLQALCNRTGFRAFFSYFERNWNTCKEMWVLFERKHLAHFEVHTNNHLENWFGHFKNIVKPSMTMRDCIAAIIGCDKRTENDYLYRCNRVGQSVNRNYDSEMMQGAPVH
ncbi:hypothetical protein PR003_g20351 [Phytophthora rubi]|uniref:DUF5575 domain-containing protein n=1 Tax=Phytophthora rubi TaxID=129364 RepID=A0A6A4DNS2_9STRA|nr:hypothetical protein PR003_g20351 [Phytophthora rubi]